MVSNSFGSFVNFSSLFRLFAISFDTIVNKEIAALQKVIQETDTSELDEYWLY